MKKLYCKPLKPREATFAHIDWFVEHGVDRFDFGILPPRAAEDLRSELRRDKPRDWLSQKTRLWLLYQNKSGRDIYVRPAMSLPSHRILMLDDLSADAVLRLVETLRAAGLEFLIVETSEANYQAWIAGRSAMDRETRKQAERALVEQLGADRNSADGMHFGRLAGFNNKKPERGDALVHIAEPRLFIPKSRKPEVSDSERVRKALENIHPDAISRADWVRIGRALQHLPDGEDIWYSWNNRSNFADIEKSKVTTWKSFHGAEGSLTIGTIFHLVNQHGTGGQT